MIQLGIEYAPNPPLNAGREALAPAAITQLVRERVRRRNAEPEALR